MTNEIPDRRKLRANLDPKVVAHLDECSAELERFFENAASVEFMPKTFWMQGGSGGMSGEIRVTKISAYPPTQS